MNTSPDISLSSLKGLTGWEVDLGAHTCRYTKKYQGLIRYQEQPDGLFSQETPSGTNGPAKPLAYWVNQAESF